MTSPANLRRTFQKWWKRHLLALALMQAGGWFLATILLVTPIYFTNDDLVFNLLVAGVGVTDVPDSHLMFTSLMIGKPLAWLYSQLPDVPWYPIYLGFSTWLACGVLLYVLLLRMPMARATGFFALYMGLFGVLLFSRMQFTTTALHCGLAGLVSLHHAWAPTAAPIRHRIWLAFAGFAMLLLAAAIRIHIVLWLAILAFPLLYVVFGQARGRQRAQLLVAGAFCALLFGGVYYIDRAAYQADPQWREFQEINSLRSSFNDYRQISYSEQYRPIFEAAGWDKLDFEMVGEWFYADEKKYSTEKLRNIVGAFPAWKSGASWKDIQGLYQSMAGAPLVLMALGFILWLLASGGLRGEGKVIVLGMLAMLLLAVPLLHLMAKAPPPYLLLPSFSFIAYWAIYWEKPSTGTTPVRQDRRKQALFAGGLVMAIAGGVSYGVAIHASRDLPGKMEFLVRSIQSGNESVKPVYVVWGNSLPPGFAPAYRWGDVLRGVNLIWIGASLHSPVTKRQLSRFEIDNLYSALYEKEDVLLLNNKPSREKLLADYAQSRFGVQIEFQQLSRMGGLRVVRVAKVSK